MKNRYFLSVVLSIVFMVGAYSCTTLQETADGYEDDRLTSRNSSFYDPFYNQSTPVLVRDAYTGRLFYVYPTNSLSPFDNRMYDSRYTNSRFNNNRYYSRPSTGRPHVSDEQRQQTRERQEEARRKILGRQQ